LAKRTTVGEESHVFYYHTDHLGSTRLVTDESGTIVTDVTYHPFGESVVTGDESFLFTGKEKDSTGLYYYGARYHDPELGRFITSDPFAGKIAVPQSLNRYAYCLNNPVKFIDPAGLTFRICNVGTGVCRRISETRSSNNPNRPEWIAYDKNGDKITDSNHIKELMASEKEENRAQAVYLMLLVTHPEIEGESGQVGVPKTEGYMDEGYLFEVTIKGEKVYTWIVLRDEFVSEKGYPAHTFLMGLNVEGKMYDMVKLTVYQAAFESFAHLYHVIGHEGVHVYELATTGKTTEVNAYVWNLGHAYSPVPYPWDIGILMLIYRNEINPFHPPFGSAVPA
jgi:RHS repeat-associated protein